MNNIKDRKLSGEILDICYMEILPDGIVVFIPKVVEASVEDLEDKND